MHSHQCPKCGTRWPCPFDDSCEAGGWNEEENKWEGQTMLVCGACEGIEDEEDDDAGQDGEAAADLLRS